MLDYEKMIKIHHRELWDEWREKEKDDEKKDEADKIDC